MKLAHTPFAVEPLDKLAGDGAKQFRFTADWIAHCSGHEDFTLRTAIRKARTTDFASVPRCLKWLLSDALCYGYEAAWHDANYYLGVPKAIADGVFLEAMLQNQRIPKWQAWAAFLAVLFFGGAAYRAHRKAGHPK
jgi:hypothetical protein